MHKLSLLLLLCYSVVSFRGQSQPSADLKKFNPYFEVFTLPGGTNSNKVQKILQDKTGYVWFATQGGLIRYDGINFRTYHYEANNPDSPLSDLIEDIFIDDNGIIWMTHWYAGGLTSFNPREENFTRYVHDTKNPESISAGATCVVAEDTSGYIWIGGLSGLNRLDRATGRFTHFHHDVNDPNSLSSDSVRAIYVDKSGTLWIGTGIAWDPNDRLHKLGGLNRFDPSTGEFTRYMHDPENPASIADNKVRAIFEDSKGNFWIGTAGDGLQQLNRSTGKFKHFYMDPGNPGQLSRPYLRGQTRETLPFTSRITSIFEDNKGLIWITAVEGGLNIYDPVSGVVRHFQQGTAEGDFVNNSLWNVSQTKDGTLWVASGGDGSTLYKVKEREKMFPFYGIKQSSKDSLAIEHEIFKDSFGKIWMAQESPTKLERLDRQTGREDVISLGVPADSIQFIFGMVQDKAGSLWVNANNGQFVGNPQTGIFNPFRNPAVSENIARSFNGKMLQTSDGDYWLPSWFSGLYHFDPAKKLIGHLDHISDNNMSLAGSRVFALFEDSSGYLWIGGGTPFGEPEYPMFIDRYDKKTGSFVHYINDNLSSMVREITQDNMGNIWFYSGNNILYKLDPQTGEIKPYSSFNRRLPDGNIFSLLRDLNGNLWLGMSDNIIKIEPETDQISVFGNAQGVKQSNGMLNGSVSSDGEVLMAVKNGFHAFYPDKLMEKYKDRVPDLRITGFHLSDFGLNRSEKSSFNKPIWQLDNITLNYDQNFFSFSAACFDFYDPSHNRIEFKLDGYDRGWRTDIRDGETPLYINIPPGKYNFRLRGTNSFGIWNKGNVTMQVIILPPWWKSWWAYIIYGILALFLVFLFDKIQRRRLIQKERATAQEKELVQAREIEKAYNELKNMQSQLIQAEKMASLGELTAGIAHEIQNPLNFVNNFSEVNAELIEELKSELATGNLHPATEIAENIKNNELKINQHGKRADSIVKSMLQHSRGSSDKKEPTDINALADEFFNLAYHGMRARDKSFNAELKKEFDPDLPKVDVVPQDIGRVLVNLINNAFHAVSVLSAEASSGAEVKTKATAKADGSYKPTVTLSTKKLENKIEIRISDNGPGIPDNIKEKIFQPFFTTKPAGQGTGLGLSLSYDIIKTHHGEISVNTKKGSGTEFIIELPIV